MKLVIIIYMANAFGDPTVRVIDYFNNEETVKTYNKIVNSKEYINSNKKNRIELIPLDSAIAMNYIR